jgi:hypothetical protein
MAILQHHLPQYRYNIRIGKFVDCQKSFFTGATIVFKRDGIVINPSFPSAGANMVFTLIMLLSGILIGIFLWLLVFKGGQNRVRDDVARVLGPALGAQLPERLMQGMQQQLPQGDPHQQWPQQPPQGYPQQPPMQQPPMQQPPMQQQPQMQQQAPQQQGLAPGSRVLVVASDGNRYPATIAQAAQGQYLCTMPDGNSYWFPQQSVGPA